MAKKIRHTYGEAYTIVKTNMKLVNGKWKSVQKPPRFQRMNREDAGKYYNKKINGYWHKMLSSEIKNEADREVVIKMISSNCAKYRRFCFSLNKKTGESS